MDISLKTIEDLAPDQASLNSAKKLLKPAQWPVLGQAPSLNSIWGQCQGSGANPYSIMADVVDHGYKCTCPSRKFPCKHVLALLWQFADKPAQFSDCEPPDWVQEWLGRRRKSKTAEPAVASNGGPSKSIAIADVSEPVSQISVEQQAKLDEASAKRKAKTKANTEASIQAGLTDFQNWLDDQLRTGVGGLLKELNSRCRTVAARLVDAKAANFASRVDELPAKILALPQAEQASGLFKELGQLVLLSDAWLANCEDPDTRRAVATAENREQVLSDPNANRITGTWLTVGEQILTRRDGLISHTAWLLNSAVSDVQFAMLLDQYPASAGRREAGFNTGAQFQGEVVYYPSRKPLRALVSSRENLESANFSVPAVNKPLVSVQQTHLQWLQHLPWLELHPNVLHQGRVVKHGNAYWWMANTSETNLPIANQTLPDIVMGCDVQMAFVLWDGQRLELLSVVTAWGLIAC